MHTFRPASLRLGFVALALALAGCASHGPKTLETAFPNGIEPTAIKNDVDFIPSKEGDRQCGPTSLAMIIQVHDPKIDLDKIRSMTFTASADGSYTRDMISAARRLGYVVYHVPSIEQMIQLASEQKPVLVFQNLGLRWYPKWHYSVLVGYDVNSDKVFLHSGEDAYEEMKFNRFKRTWQRGGQWSYLILKPSEIPLHSSFDEALENAMVLEKLEQKENAKAVYQAMSSRWPDRYEPDVGIANTTSPNDPEAVEALKRATQKQPEHHALYYNLAYLYLIQKKPKLSRQMKSLTLKYAPKDKQSFYEEQFQAF